MLQSQHLVITQYFWLGNIFIYPAALYRSSEVLGIVQHPAYPCGMVTSCVASGKSSHLSALLRKQRGAAFLLGVYKGLVKISPGPDT